MLAERAQAQEAALEQRLEDARVAVLGYQVDCERERSLHARLEAEIEELLRDCAALDSQERAATDAALKLAKEASIIKASSKLAKAEEALVAAVEGMRGSSTEKGISELEARLQAVELRLHSSSGDTGKLHSLSTIHS